jgi:hypothetical protein
MKAIEPQKIYVEKLTVMFSAFCKKSGFLRNPAAQQAQGQGVEKCETVSCFGWVCGVIAQNRRTDSEAVETAAGAFI